MSKPQIIVYDKEGNECFHHHAIDAREAIRTGNFFARNPKVSAPPEPPPPPVEIALGEDIELETTKEPVEAFDSVKNPEESKEPEFETTGKKKKRVGK